MGLSGFLRQGLVWEEVHLSETGGESCHGRVMMWHGSRYTRSRRASPKQGCEEAAASHQEKHSHRVKGRAHKESWACRKARPASAQTQESGAPEDLDKALPLCSPSKCLSVSEAELDPSCRV